MHLISYRRAGTIAAALVLATVCSQRLSAQTGSLQGRITDSTGASVVGTTITVASTALRTAPTARGVYALNGVPAGRQVLRVRALGFVPESISVNIASGTVTTQDVTLHRAATRLAAVVVMTGSRARHTAAEELAVPVDVYTSADIVQQGTTETSQVLANLSPSVNFPKQAVTDATEIVRPFTLRGLSPDHSLVLINGVRRHQTSLMNVFFTSSRPSITPKAAVSCLARLTMVRASPWPRRSLL